MGTGHSGSTRHGSAIHGGPREKTFVTPDAQSRAVRLETSSEGDSGRYETIKFIFWPEDVKFAGQVQLLGETWRSKKSDKSS